jgi:tripartite-type tricarboxylate transporter receptor subunit TctC
MNKSWVRAMALPALAFCAGLFSPVDAAAQAPAASPASYPAKPIRLVIPFPPGGPLDAAGRALGQKLSEAWGQPVVVENKPGAGGNIGADQVAKSPADGYTLVMGALSTHAVNPHLYSKMPYDALKDFAPVALVATTPNVLVINPSVPANSASDLIALARANPGKLSFASGSNGSAGHLAGELFKSLAKIDIVHVPYKGGAPAMQDLLGGQVQFMFDNLANSTPHVKAGKLKAIAVTTAKRSTLAPELPTMAEVGVPGFDISTWYGIMAPAGTPPEIVRKLNGEIVRYLSSDAAREQFKAQGAEPGPMSGVSSPEQFDAFIRAENAKYAKIVRDSGARVD